MIPRGYSKHVDLDYLIERDQAAKDRSAGDIIGDFFKLTHRLEKAIEAIEACLQRLKGLNPAKAAVLLKAWGEGSRLKEFVLRLGRAAEELKEKEPGPEIFPVAEDEQGEE